MIFPSSLNNISGPPQLPLQPTPQPRLALVPGRHPHDNDRVLLGGEGALLLGLSSEGPLEVRPFILTLTCSPVQQLCNGPPVDPLIPIARCQLLLLLLY
jgi:hypothetical protein